MNAPQLKNKQGFTIIEVVLVLAIAALIFLMVFIALPALQRNQRDTQRKNDLGRFVSAISSSQSNNRGKLPELDTTAKVNTFVDNYLKSGGDTFEDPTGTPYVVEYSSGASAAPSNANTIIYSRNGQCGDDGAIIAGSGTRKFAVSIKLEGSTAYCQNN